MTDKKTTDKGVGETVPDENTSQEANNAQDDLSSLRDEILQATQSVDKAEQSDMNLEGITKLKDELAAKAEQVLRVQAELQNVRSRAERDVAKAHKFALEKFINELLPVVDSLEQAIGGTGAEDEKAMQEGVKLTIKMFLSVLEKFGVEQLDPAGEKFNPEFHEAMTMQETSDAKANTVLFVVQKGYVLNQRLVRPARVIVAKAPASE